MKYIDEFRDGELAGRIAASIRTEADPARRYHFMEFCGGHTHAISRYGVSDLLPDNVRMIHGPGCPVCVLPIGRVDQAIRLVLNHGVSLCTYGDCLRVPASDGLSLLKAKARVGQGGGEVRMVYSSLDAGGHPAGGGAGAEEFLGALLSCADAISDCQHSRIAGSAPMGHGATRWFCRPGACLHHHRQPPLRVFCRGIPQAGGDCRF